MRNLKKMLSLVMALAMIASFMVVGASAADFTDVKDIKNTDAVQTLVSLGVLKGYEDGSFKPEGTVTRAEMAKMICVVMNGGKDPSLGSAITNFKDVASNHWAAGYISYCDNMGYISGYEDGTFKPDADVTGTQAAKMLLTAIGFSADAESYTGANWAINVDVRANGRGIYDELGGTNPALGLTRDNAAQMVYNAVGAQMVEYNYTPVTEGGQITLKPVLKDMTYDVMGTNNPETILHSKFGMATQYGYMTGFSYDSVKEKYTYTFSAAANFGGNIINDSPFTGTLKTAVDYTSLFGQKVKVLYKNTDTVFGMYAEDSSVLFDGFAGNLPTSIAATADSVKVDGTTYKLDSAASSLRVYNNNTSSNVMLSTLSGNDATPLYTIRFIDNDGNGKVNAAVKTPVVLAKIGYVGKDTITLSPVTNLGGSTLGNKDVEDIVIYDNYAKNDYVLYVNGTYTTTGEETITKVEVATGTVEGSKSGEYLVDGEWLSNDTLITLNINDTIEYIALGGHIYYTKVTSGATGTGALMMAYDAGYTAVGGTKGQSLETKVIFADGTKKTVTIATINGVSVPVLAGINTVLGATMTSTTDASGANVNLSGVTVANALIGEMVTYKVNNDGDYEVKTIPAGYTPGSGAKILGYDGTLATGAGAGYYVNSGNAVNGKELASDATVFVFVGAKNDTTHTNKGYVYAGKEIKNTSADYGDINTTYTSGLYGKTNGFTYAQAVVLNATTVTGKPGIITGTNYGYLVSDAWQTHSDTKDYVNFKYWNGTTEVTAKAEGTDLTNFVAGAVITFDSVSDGIIKNVSVPATTTGQITGWDGTKKVSLGGSNREISDDTVILYVNSKDKKGVAGDIGNIQEAADVDGTAGIENNARWITPVSGTGVALLVVDVNNNMKANPATRFLSGAIAAGDINTALSQTDNVTVNASAMAAADTVNVADGKVLNVTNTHASNALTVNVADGAILNITATGVVDGMLVMTVAPGGTVMIPNGTLIGNGGTVTTTDATVTVTTSGTGGLTFAASSGTLTVDGQLGFGVKDTVNISGSAKIVGANDGDRVHFDGSTTITALTGGNFYSAAGNATTAGTVITTMNDVKVHQYAWSTVYTNNSGATTMGWLQVG